MIGGILAGRCQAVQALYAGLGLCKQYGIASSVYRARNRLASPGCQGLYQPGKTLLALAQYYRVQSAAVLKHFPGKGSGMGASGSDMGPGVQPAQQTCKSKRAAPVRGKAGQAEDIGWPACQN